MSEQTIEEHGKESTQRRYGLLILALLLLSIFVYSTYSYFTYSTEVGGSIQLSSGNVQLGDPGSEGWRYEPLGGHVNSLGEAGGEALAASGVYDVSSFSNLRPGDRFVKDITVAYTGTLEADAVVTFEDPSGDDGLFTVTATLDDSEISGDSITVQPGEEFIVQMAIELPILGAAETPGEGRNLIESAWSTDELDGLVEISVVQSNVTAAGSLK